MRACVRGCMRACACVRACVMLASAYVRSFVLLLIVCFGVFVFGCLFLFLFLQINTHRLDT